MWSVEDEWRAPVGDFPPPWASAWGDDPYGLWADLTVNGATQRMRWIEPSGEDGFWMGAPQAERDVINEKASRSSANRAEYTPLRVAVPDGFWLADTPCTQAFWRAVVGENPSRFKQSADAAERPVEDVSWDDVMRKFVARFATMPDWGTGQGLCLPTDVEWEYAARAGTRTAYWWGDGWDAACGNADITGERYLDDAEGTTPVRRYVPNPWGLYDVHGNVFEWCSDVWQPGQGAPNEWRDEDVRVARGGSWLKAPYDARAASRFGHRLWYASQDRGFRFALRHTGWSEAG